MRLRSLALSAALFFPALSALAEPATGITREYRPLEAKKVSIRTGAQLTPLPGEPGNSEEFRRQGWYHFDRQEWAQASESFLSALERDPESLEVAEALAMCLYRSGQYGSAYRLGRELNRIMPSVAQNVSGTVHADVRYMIRRGAFEAAREFLAHFPSEDPSYRTAHVLLKDAATITAVTAPDGNRSLEPDGPNGIRPLVRN